MAFGLGYLRLPSQQFWQMSLREIDCALSQYEEYRSDIPPLEREKLESLMKSYPDV